jgi:hypothetical protein
VLHESAGVPGLAAPAPQGVLEWRERTDPARELDQDTPHGGRNVNPREARPAKDEKPTEHDERHEHRVDDDDQVGESGEKHSEICCRGNAALA